ncbi:MAG: CDP-alcohol phosphatidyltransferase family protein [Saccharofermentanales bacterium]
MKKENVTVPNVLSLSRVVFLPVLFAFVLLDMQTAFLVGYIVLGATDMFDGLIARRFNMKSELGKKLDSIADIPFYVSTAWFIQRLYPQYLKPNNVLLIAFFAIFFLSFIVSGIRCKKPIMMHTFLLKLNGVLVYFLVVISPFADTTYFISTILVIYLIGFTEEIIIFIRHGEIDPDTVSLFSLK